MLYQHPGVYIEHVPSNALSIEAASTSVTAFVGHVRRGARVTDVAGKPVFIANAGQYAAIFGPLGGGPGGIKNDGQVADAFGHAVNLYFTNGGTKAYIVPISSNDGTAATLNTPAVAAIPAVGGAPAVPAVAAQVGIEFVNAGANRRLVLTASSPGLWANTLMARLEAGQLPNEFKLPPMVVTISAVWPVVKSKMRACDVSRTASPSCWSDGAPSSRRQLASRLRYVCRNGCGFLRHRGYWSRTSIPIQGFLAILSKSCLIL